MATKAKKTPAPAAPAPTNAAPTTPANPPEPTFLEQLRTMTDAEVMNLAKVGYVKMGTELTKMKERFDSAQKDNGLICGRLLAIYLTRKAKHEILGDTSFKEFHVANTGGEPHGNVQSLGNLVNWLVDMPEPLLTEQQYTKIPAKTLLKAHTPLSELRKTIGSDTKTFAADARVQRIIRALTEPVAPGDKTAEDVIAEVRDEVKGVKKDAPKADDAKAPTEGELKVPMPDAIRLWLGQNPAHVVDVLRMATTEVHHYRDATNAGALVAQVGLLGAALLKNSVFDAYTRTVDAQPHAPTTKTTQSAGGVTMLMPA